MRGTGTARPRASRAASDLRQLRGGDVVGEHEVRFLGEGERLLLTHSAHRSGGVRPRRAHGGQWLAGRPPGRYAHE